MTERKQEMKLWLRTKSDDLNRHGTHVAATIVAMAPVRQLCFFEPHCARPGTS
jgi:hypothetical protein